MIQESEEVADAAKPTETEEDKTAEDKTAEDKTAETVEEK